MLFLFQSKAESHLKAGNKHLTHHRGIGGAPIIKKIAGGGAPELAAAR